MMSRTLNRSIARAHYNQFAKQWRRDLRTAGLYGQPRSPKRPTFNQWFAMHMNDTAMTKESTPGDVVEYLGLDPWDPANEGTERPAFETDDSDRGVVTIPMFGDTEEDAG